MAGAAPSVPGVKISAVALVRLGFQGQFAHLRRRGWPGNRHRPGTGVSWGMVSTTAAVAPVPVRKPNPLDDDPFTLKSITKSDPPVGVDSENWHRYVITQGHNTIVGQLQGSKANTERAVQEIVERLNERRRGKTGRVQLSPGRKKKGATPPPSDD